MEHNSGTKSLIRKTFILLLYALKYQTYDKRHLGMFILQDKSSLTNCIQHNLMLFNEYFFRPAESDAFHYFIRQRDKGSITNEYYFKAHTRSILFI